MINYEDFYLEKNLKNIVGIDEVGRGCFFGDVVACAIIMPYEEKIKEIKDSKKLTPKKRLELYDIILKNALAVGIGRVSSKEIDEINIKNATHKAMLMAVDNLRDRDSNKIKPDVLLVDAEHLDTKVRQESIIKGDELCYSISCASIVAKVYRDRLCLKWGKDYPEYGIERHKGYGTKEHREMIRKYGPTPMHRMTFLKNTLKAKNE